MRSYLGRALKQYKVNAAGATKFAALWLAAQVRRQRSSLWSVADDEANAEAAQNGAHQMCEMMLCVLIKSELVHLCDATTACDLRCLVTRLEREWRDSGTVGAAPLARLGRVLLVKLDNVEKQPDSPKNKQF